MRKTIFVAASLFLIAGSIALAGQGDPHWIDKSNLITQMQSHGYSSIVVKAEKDHWKGEAVKDGHIIQFEAAPRTGKILKSGPVTID